MIVKRTESRRAEIVDFEAASEAVDEKRGLGWMTTM